MVMKALKKVLVVDDDPIVARSFDRVLSNKGYAVITAANGEEALNKIAAEEYDVVYTDIRMPGMDGVEVARRIKSSRPWLPVVIVTGYGSDENVARAKAAGVSTVLHKPLSPDMIEGSALEAMLEEPRVAVAAEATVAAPALPAQNEAPKRSVMRFAKNVVLFFAAPLIGLLYALAFPVIGLCLVARYAGGALLRRSPGTARIAKRAGMFVAAPLTGLAYAIVLPFVGLGMLVLLCAKPLFSRAGRE
jgi:CheY-like chemotaxis protein